VNIILAATKDNAIPTQKKTIEPNPSGYRMLDIATAPLATNHGMKMIQTPTTTISFGRLETAF
jgi:hypothetical protein